MKTPAGPLSRLAVKRNLGRVLLTLVWLAGLGYFWSSVTAGSHVRFTLAALGVSYLALWGLVFLWSEASPTENLQRFLLVSLSIAFTVALLEIPVLLRLVDFRVTLSTPVAEPWKHPENLLDPVLLHIHKPHAHYFWRGVDYRYDGHGLRNASDLQTADLVVVGDSFIEGWGVPAADLLTTRLQGLTGRTVANVAQSWYGPQQELELLRRYGLPLRPRTCIWVFYEGNDLEDLHRYEETAPDWPRLSREMNSFWQRSFTRNGSLAVHRVANSLQGRPWSLEPVLVARSGLFQASAGRTPMVFHNEGLYLSASDYDALHELAPILRHACDLCEGAGAEFLFVFIPTKFRVYKPMTAFDVDAEPLYWVLNDLPARVEALVRQNLPRARFLDLTPALTAEAHRGEVVYLEDTHLSKAGHRAAAAAIAAALSRPPATLKDSLASPVTTESERAGGHPAESNSP